MEGFYLRVHTPPQFGDELAVSEGDTFEIVGEDEDLVSIVVGDYELAFTKEPDKLGLSYATWFDVVTEVE